MKKRILSAMLLATVSGSLFAQTLVTVNGTKIDSSDIDNQIKAMNIKEDTPQIRQALLNLKVVDTIIIQEAKSLKLDHSDEYKNALKQAREQAAKQGLDKQPNFKQNWANFENDLLRQAYAAYILRTQPATDAELKQAYDQLTEARKGDFDLQLSEIATRSKADADKAAQELSKKSFADVAKAISVSPNAQQGGMIQGYVSQKQLQAANPAVYAVVKDMKVGQYSKPIAQPNNLFVIVRVNEKRAFQKPDFDSVKNQLTAYVQNVRLDNTARALMQKANVVPAN